MKTLQYGHFSNIPKELRHDHDTSISNHPEQGKIVHIAEESGLYDDYEEKHR